MRRHSNSNNSGFTLIELIIVILIVGIITAVVTTKMTSQSGISARLAADMAASDIRAVQHAAMYTGTARSIIFGENQNTYTADGLFHEDRALPGDAIAATAYSITFNSLGEPDQGGNFTVSCRGDSKTITIEEITGKVTIN